LQAEDLRPGLETIIKLHGAVEAIQNMKFPGLGSQVDVQGRTAEQKAKEGEHAPSMFLRECYGEKFLLKISEVSAESLDRVVSFGPRAG
jgi:hypothetical protein